MPTGLILFDVDKTLFDTQYQLTIPEQDWCAKIKRTQGYGWQLGLNSDSGFGSLRDHAVAWGMNGPIISERGAIVNLGNGEMADITGEQCTEAKLFVDIRQRFVQALGQLDFRVDASLDNIKCRSDVGVFAVVNPLRQRSIEFWVRQRSGGTGELKFCSSALATAVACLRSIITEMLPSAVIDDLDWDINPEYGICIVHFKQTQKKNAVVWLLKRLRLERVYMVGDSMSDWIDDARVVHCVVGNAKEQFKAKCAYVSKGQITQGAMEIMDWLTR